MIAAMRAKDLAGQSAGQLDAAVISTTLEQHADTVDGCHKIALKSRPDLVGNLVVRFAIGADGSVPAAAALATDLDDRPLETCVVGAIRRTACPPPSGDGTVVANYTLNFRLL